MSRVPVNRHVTFWSLAVLGCAADLATKEWIFSVQGAPGPGWPRTWWLWEGVLGLTTSLNEGTLFSLAQGGTPLFSALTVATIVGILIWLFRYEAAQSWLLTIALGLVMAGALGNLYDRLGIPGLAWQYANDLHAVGDHVYAVRDWIDVRIINWPIFNLADSWIVCGAALLAWHSVFVATPQESGASKAVAAGSRG